MEKNYPSKTVDNDLETLSHNIITLIALDIYEQQKSELVEVYGIDMLQQAYQHCIDNYMEAIENIKKLFIKYN